jgi:hypothetical protein
MFIAQPKSSSGLTEDFFIAPERSHQVHTANAVQPPPADSEETQTALTVPPSTPTDDTPTATAASAASAVQSNAAPKPELLILAAPPACGKSTLARRFERGGYLRVNQDTLGSFDKCAAAAKAALQAGQSVCVDNTNMDVNTRAKWVQLAKRCNVAVSTAVEF